MNGDDPGNEITSHTFTDGQQIKIEKIQLEEAYTVGFESRPVSSKAGRYPTENELRRENQKNIRVSYKKSGFYEK